MPIRDQQQGYRRGLVLGLTMAEIAVLVIFVLLLVFGALLTRQAREAEALHETVALLEPARAELDRIADRLGGSPEAIVEALARAAETQRRLVLIEEEVGRLRELEQTLESIRSHGTPEQPLPEIFRELMLLRDATVDAGIAPVPEALRRALADAAEAKEILAAVAGEDAATLGEVNARLAREAENLKAQMANLLRQAQLGGRGLDHPPCWPTRDGKAEYIFDVALTGQGLILRDRDLPHRVADRSELPLAGLVFGEELTPERFLVLTAPLFRWSDDKSCRFVVRAFDTTGPADKAIYKRHMRVLEQHFYKYEVLTEPF
jgi:hypothetical protein